MSDEPSEVTFQDLLLIIGQQTAQIEVLKARLEAERSARVRLEAALVGAAAPVGGGDDGDAAG